MSIYAEPLQPPRRVDATTAAEAAALLGVSVDSVAQQTYVGGVVFSVSDSTGRENEVACIVAGLDAVRGAVVIVEDGQG